MSRHVNSGVLLPRTRIKTETSARIRQHTRVCKYTILLITWERAPARKTMTIYIDDDWNACAPVRKMTWVNQLSGYETRQRTEARITAGRFVCTASDRRNAARSLYANSLTCDTRSCILPRVSNRQKENARYRQCYDWTLSCLCNVRHKYTYNAASNYAYRS